MNLYFISVIIRLNYVFFLCYYLHSLLLIIVDAVVAANLNQAHIDNHALL